jgi:hypothetical protein
MATVIPRKTKKRMGWLLRKERVKKKKVSKVPIVDLGDSLGGDATTRGMVSRMEVREAIIEAPLEAVSQ